MEPEPTHPYKYWAFISYSSKDGRWGEWLRKRIENYSVPKDLRGHTFPDGATLGKHLRPVFRDRDELPGADNLGEKIHAALTESRYLIVLCSPNSSQSKWVNKEIEEFQAMGKGQNILALILNGQPNSGNPTTECFPPALRYPHEPVAGDLRKEGDGKERGFLKILAGIAKLNFDEIYRRHERDARQRRTAWAVVGTSLLLLFAGIATFASFQWKRAEENLRESETQKREANKRLVETLWTTAEQAEIDDSYPLRALHLFALAQEAAENVKTKELLSCLIRFKLESMPSPRYSLTSVDPHPDYSIRRMPYNSGFAVHGSDFVFRGEDLTFVIPKKTISDSAGEDEVLELPSKVIDTLLSPYPYTLVASSLGTEVLEERHYHQRRIVVWNYLTGDELLRIDYPLESFRDPISQIQFSFGANPVWFISQIREPHYGDPGGSHEDLETTIYDLQKGKSVFSRYYRDWAPRSKYPWNSHFTEMGWDLGVPYLVKADDAPTVAEARPPLEALAILSLKSSTDKRTSYLNPYNLEGCRLRELPRDADTSVSDSIREWAPDAEYACLDSDGCVAAWRQEQTTADSQLQRGIPPRWKTIAYFPGHRTLIEVQGHLTRVFTTKDKVFLCARRYIKWGSTLEATVPFSCHYEVWAIDRATGVTQSFPLGIVQAKNIWGLDESDSEVLSLLYYKSEALLVAGLEDGRVVIHNLQKKVNRVLRHDLGKDEKLHIVDYYPRSQKLVSVSSALYVWDVSINTANISAPDLVLPSALPKYCLDQNGACLFLLNRNESGIASWQFWDVRIGRKIGTVEIPGSYDNPSFLKGKTREVHMTGPLGHIHILGPGSGTITSNSSLTELVERRTDTQLLKDSFKLDLTSGIQLPRN